MLPGTCGTSAALNMAAPGTQGASLPTHDARASAAHAVKRHARAWHCISIASQLVSNGERSLLHHLVDSASDELLFLSHLATASWHRGLTIQSLRCCLLLHRAPSRLVPHM